MNQLAYLRPPLTRRALAHGRMMITLSRTP